MRKAGLHFEGGGNQNEDFGGRVPEAAELLRPGLRRQLLDDERNRNRQAPPEKKGSIAQGPNRQQHDQQVETEANAQKNGKGYQGKN